MLGILTKLVSAFSCIFADLNFLPQKSRSSILFGGGPRFVTVRLLQGGSWCRGQQINVQQLRET